VRCEKRMKRTKMCWNFTKEPFGKRARVCRRSEVKRKEGRREKNGGDFRVFTAVAPEGRWNAKKGIGGPEV